MCHLRRASIVTFFVATTASAGGTGGISVQPSVSLQTISSSRQDADRDSTTTGTAGALYINLGLGLTSSSGIHFGGKVLMRTANTEWESTFGDESSDKSATSMTGYGPTIGYEPGSGLTIAASYILTADETYVSTTTDESGKSTFESREENSNGILIDLGYAIPAGGFSVGPQLVYFSRTHRRETNRSTDSEGAESVSENEGTYKNTTIRPYFGIWFRL